MSCGAPYCPSGAPLQPPDPEAGKLFGFSLAVDGEWLAVGAPGGDFKVPLIPSLDKLRTGIVYLYRFNDSSWVHSHFVRFSGFAADDRFGWSVDLWNNSLVVGAAFDDVEGHAGAGSAHVFMWNGADWVEKTFLRAGSLSGGDQFGTAVSVGLYGVQVGAPYDDAGAADGGAVHFFYDALWLFEDGFESGDSSAWSAWTP